MCFQDIDHSSRDFQTDQFVFNLSPTKHGCSACPPWVIRPRTWIHLLVLGVRSLRFMLTYTTLDLPPKSYKPSQYPQVPQQAHLQPSTFNPPVSPGAAPVLALVVGATGLRDSKTHIVSQNSILSTDNTGEEGPNPAQQDVKVVSSGGMTGYQLIWYRRVESYHTSEGSRVGGDRGTNS
jgi:hypothetical protein